MKIEFSKVFFEERDEVGYVVLNDPPANRMTEVFWEEIYRLVTEHIAGSKVKGIIIYGNGRHYSSGVEVDRLKSEIARQVKVEELGQFITVPQGYRKDRLAFGFFGTLEIPVISAINGLCIGSGLELALWSHIRICGHGSTLGLPESTFGMIPGLGGTLRSLELCGLGRALEMVLSGQTYTAEEALHLGLVDGVTGKKETLAYCEGLLQFILRNECRYQKKNIPQYLSAFRLSNPEPASA